MYQFAPVRCIGGISSKNSPSSCATMPVHPSRMCRFRLSALYCVSTYTAPQPGVDAVGKRDVDDPVVPAKRHRRLGPVARQWKQPLSRAACKQYSKCVSHIHKAPALDSMPTRYCFVSREIFFYPRLFPAERRPDSRTFARFEAAGGLGPEQQPGQRRRAAAPGRIARASRAAGSRHGSPTQDFANTWPTCRRWKDSSMRDMGVASNSLRAWKSSSQQRRRFLR